MSIRSLRVCLALLVPCLFVDPTGLSTSEARATQDGQMVGKVTHSKTKEPVADAIVILQCSCLQGTRETRTNADGLYMFRDLPPGEYTIQVLSGQADVAKIVRMPRGAKFRANFTIDPEDEFKVMMVISGKSPRLARRDITAEAISRSVSRDFTSVVDISPTATSDSGGIRLAGSSQSSRHINGDEFNREGYAPIVEQEFLSVADAPLSTFSIDVDTAAYSNVRRFLHDGMLPPADAVRTEELVNYFDYDYAAPSPRHPMSVTVEVGDCPWESKHWLAHVGIQAKNDYKGDSPAKNLVFLIDVSGSMNGVDKLPLVKQSLKMLVHQMRPQDRLAIVVYAGSSGVALRPTSGVNKRRALAAIDRLEAGGSTHGAGGIQQAYRIARSAFIRGGVNRVLLATDGDFNVGATSAGALTRLIERKRKSGIYLSTLGFGTGNYQDDTMELLADKGNGNYAYIDSLMEARKVLVEEADATLVPVADDVKLQIEFNPRWIASYRLIGYENRRLADRDFDDDTKDAGELGAGHTVTALYELVPASDKPAKREVGPLRYQSDRTATAHSQTDELARVKLRYKRPGAARSVRVDFVAGLRNRRPAHKASENFRWSAAVAAWSLKLRNSKFAEKIAYTDVLQLARGAVGQDPQGYRRQFLSLVETAQKMQEQSIEAHSIRARDR